ncbi:Outer membrane protein beta-barrel family protein [Lishizhenia tianjinensis]|uniref:Outer membrane protein beta-barrel family protein n=1 Tax=Lishizhenia tianjinensis TaxID=477690 RepID=A0A1I7BL12_9FLAO|nr:outer membrane beta-barrel protein [Lishizhenia tianjinensis]SFT87874.1 Outer membrane protein beta-barrel family protein [Lishizhenia tianjinensis]
MTKLLFSLTCILLGWGVYAQTMKFTGVVNDTTNQKPLENVVVMAINLSDSVLLGFTRTNAAGEFLLDNIPFGEMELLFTHPRFADKSYFIIGSELNRDIHIPNVILPNIATELQEVVIYANKEPIFFKGDTLVYQADSFNVKPNAVVEDLLKRLPGIEVDEEGNIKSQGQEVAKVLVDGDEFFGDDPTVATKNLSAEGVQTVEVYETVEDTGDGEETIQVMDVRLKEGAKNGYFGKIAGGSDFQNFYEGEILLNRFKNDLKVSVFGFASNTPNTGFGWSDVRRFGLTNEMDMGYRDGVMFSSGNSRTGLPQNLKGGFYYTDKLGKDLKLGLNYTFNNNTITENTSRNSQYLFADTSFTNTEDNYGFQAQESHSLNFNMEWKIDSLTTLEFEPSVNFTASSRDQIDSSDYFTSSNTRTSGTYVSNFLTSESVDVNSMLRLRRGFKKKDRSLEFEYQYGYSLDDNSTRLLSNITYEPGLGIPDSITDQNKIGSSNTQGHRAYLEFVEPLSKKMKLQFDYKFDYFFGDQSREAFNINGSNEVLDSTFSNNFSNKRFENRIGVAATYETNKDYIMVGADFRNVEIDNHDIWRDTTYRQSVYNILPSMRYTHKFSKSMRLRVNYNTRSSQPSLNQLQPIPDNSNPNRIYEGNPDLIPDYSHNLNINFNNWNAVTGRYIWSGAYAQYNPIAFSSEVTYLSDGRTRSKTINVDGNMYAGVYAGAGINFWKRQLELKPNVNISYSETKNIINVPASGIENLENLTKNANFSGGMEVTFDFDSIRLTLGSEVGYNIPKSTFGNANQPYFRYEYTLRYYHQLPWKMEFETRIDYTVNTNRSAGYNVKPFILNASLGRRFLKTENLIVELKANDIFNQNINIMRDIQSNIITDQTTQVIARYFLLKATLRFNNTKTSEKDEQWHF